MATGVAIACTARVKDQSLLPETREAATALWGITPEALAEKVEAMRCSAVSSADTPACGLWREAIASDFALGNPVWARESLAEDRPARLYYQG